MIIKTGTWCIFNRPTTIIITITITISITIHTANCYFCTRAVANIVCVCVDITCITCITCITYNWTFPAHNDRAVADLGVQTRHRPFSLFRYTHCTPWTFIARCFEASIIDHLSSMIDDPFARLFPSNFADSHNALSVLVGGLKKKRTWRDANQRPSP